MQTTPVPTGSAAIAQWKVDVPGDYFVVDQTLTRLEKGGAAILTISGPDPAIFNTVHAGAAGSSGWQ